jgi:hypothetical protein
LVVVVVAVECVVIEVQVLVVPVVLGLVVGFP